jgi:L-serine deaminase
LPNEYSLSQNYPNPFNPTTTIEFSLRQDGRTTLEVFNILGQVVARPIDGELKAGAYQVQFNASGLSSGLYFYRLRSGSFVDTKKMLLLK